MEVFGAVASGLAIAGAAATTARLATSTFSDLRDAPTDFQALRLNVGLVQNILEQIFFLLKQNQHPVPDAVRQAFHDGLAAMHTALCELKAEYKKHTEERRLGKRAAVKWALMNSHVIEKHERRLQTALSYFNVIVSLTQMQGQSALSANVERVMAMVASLEEARFGFSSQGNELSKTTGLGSSEIRRPLVPRRLFTRTQARTLVPWLFFIGFRFTVVAAEAATRTRYSVSIRFRFPNFLGWRKAWVLAMDFVFQTEKSTWGLVPMVAPGIQPLPVVSETSEIIQACGSGHVHAARRLFAQHLASPYDTTPRNLNLLYFAIESGSASMVEFLLNEGADANRTFGSNQTTPLQWAMYGHKLEACRVLLKHGAQLDHVSARGWTPLVFLFEGMRRGMDNGGVVLMDFLHLINHDEILVGLDILDTNGEDALQHASRACTGDVLAWLMRFGSSLARYGPVPWKFYGNPMQLAIVEGNVSAFEALRPYYPIVDEEDEYGFTMLDYAARQGHDEIVRLLLEAGSEETWPAFDFMSAAESLAGEEKDIKSSQAAGSVAVGWTTESYLKYLMVLQDCRKIEITRDADSEGNEIIEVYWNAVEDLPLGYS